jgi:hypothetical protein
MVDDTMRRSATAKKKAVRDRNYRRARDRALVRLAHLYPDTYKQLLEIEKAFDEQRGNQMSYEPPLNDPVFYENEGEVEEMSPEFDTLQELEGDN